MTLYKFNYFCNYKLHSGEHWALSRFDVERSIKAANPNATGIDVWSI
jgi:hypothetical protein